MENKPIKIDLGVHLFLETPKCFVFILVIFGDSSDISRVFEKLDITKMTKRGRPHSYYLIIEYKENKKELTIMIVDCLNN